MLRLSAILAVITGVVLALGELRANWGDWQFWPLWLVDFAASALLIAGGWMVFRRHPLAQSVLASGWAFTLGMSWLSLGINLDLGVSAARDGRMGGLYVWLLGGLVASALLGLVLTLLGRTKIKS